MHQSLKVRQDSDRPKGAAQSDRKALAKGFWRVIVTTALLTTAFLKSTQLLLEYSSQNQPNLIAINARTGKVAWSIPISDDASPETFLTLAGAGRVYVGAPIEEFNKGFKIRAFNEVSGRKLWTFASKLSIPSNSIVAGVPVWVGEKTLWLNLLSEAVP